MHACIHTNDSYSNIFYPVSKIGVSPFWQSEDPVKVCSALRGSLDLKCAVIVSSWPHEPLIVTGPNKGGEHNAIIFCSSGLFPTIWYSETERFPEFIGPPTTNPAFPVSKL